MENNERDFEMTPQEGLDQEQQEMTSEQEPEEKETEEQEQQEEQIEMDVDQLKGWLGTEEGKKFLQPLLDKHFSKGLDTWKQNNLDKLVEERMEELHPTDPDKQLIQKLQNELKQKEIHDIAVKTLAEAGMPIELSRFFTGSGDVEQVKQGIEDLKTAFQKALKVEITDRLKSIGGTPEMGNKPNRSITKKQLLDMPYDQRMAYYKKNPQEFNRIMKG